MHWYLNERSRKQAAVRQALVERLTRGGGVVDFEIREGALRALILTTRDGERLAVTFRDIADAQRMVNYLGTMGLLPAITEDG